MPKRAVFLFFLFALIGAGLFIFFTFPTKTRQLWPSKSQSRAFQPLPPEESFHTSDHPASSPQTPPQLTALPFTGLTLHLFAWAQGPEVDRLQTLVASYSHQTGNRVALSVSNTEAQYEQDLADALKSKELPDVCLIDASNFSGLKRDADLAVLPTPAHLPASVALHAFTEGQGLRAFPNEYSVQMLYYNSQIFNRAGLAEPGQHWTLDIMESISRAITSQHFKDGSGQPIYALEINPTFALWNTFSAAAGDAVLDSDGWHLGDSLKKVAHLRGLEIFSRYFHELNVIPPVEFQNQDSGHYFSQGQSALWIGMSAESPHISGLPTQMTLLPKELKLAPQADFRGWGVCNQSLHRTEAIHLAEFLSQSPLHTGWLLPVLPSVESGLSSLELAQAQSLQTSFLVPRSASLTAQIASLDRILFVYSQARDVMSIDQLYSEIVAQIKPAPPRNQGAGN